MGKNGQLGEAIVSEANSFGLEVVALGRAELDITEKAQIKDKLEKIRPNILINAAAYNLVGGAETQPSEAIAVNCEAVLNLARMCKEMGSRFVTFSTDYVFDGEKGSPYEEDDIPNPLQVYGKSKHEGEIAVLNNYPDNSFIIRTCGVYGGQYGSPGKGNFVLNIMEQGRNNNAVEVSSEQIVNPTYATDLAKATLDLLQKKTDPGIYHLASEGYCSWYEFAEEIFKLADIKTRLVAVDREGFSGGVMRPKFSALKNIKAKEMAIELSSWQKGVASYFKFLKK